jgi:hypothetical protein
MRSLVFKEWKNFGVSKLIWLNLSNVVIIRAEEQKRPWNNMEGLFMLILLEVVDSKRNLFESSNLISEVFEAINVL